MRRTTSRKQAKILVNPARCMGCHSCELACAVAHSTGRELYAAISTGEKPGYRITIETYDNLAIPIHCHHCEDAPCMTVCPTGAIYRDEENGAVILIAERCIGCRMCMHACPFGVITVHPMGKGVLKCDQCIERLQHGEEPACSEACPTGALRYGAEEEEVLAKRQQSAQRLVQAQSEAALKG